MNKRRLGTSLLVGIAVLGTVAVLGAAGVSALTDTTGNSPFLTTFANKLGVSPDKVETALQETHTQLRSDRLDKAVSDGKITADQKNAILAKQAETKAKLDAIQAQKLTAEERRAAVKAVRDEVKSWAEANKIPLGLIRPVGGGMHRGGKLGAMGGMRGEMR